MATRKSVSDVYNNGEFFLFLWCRQDSDVDVRELTSEWWPDDACRYVFLSVILLLYFVQDPSATLMMFPSRSTTNFAAQQKWACLLVSVHLTVSPCWWTHRLVRYSNCVSLGCLFDVFLREGYLLVFLDLGLNSNIYISQERTCSRGLIRDVRWINYQ